MPLYDSTLSHLLAQSFAFWTKRPLLKADDIPHALYHAPFALVAHGTEADPIFCYANLCAQALWEMSWEEFTRMPSRLSAEPVVAKERNRLLEEARHKGYIDDYRGMRISKNGRRFLIKDTILWNVVDAAGISHGQAAVINHWEFL